MAQLPLKLPLEQMQSKWKSQLDPLLSNINTQGQLLSATVLAVGNNTINHKLSRNMQGWYIVDIDGPATIYRSQPFNDSTLVLNSTAICTINLWVF